MEETVQITREITRVTVTTDGRVLTARQVPISVIQTHARMEGLVIVQMIGIRVRV